jgi:transcriptional regulator with XRE-family HTH domain
MNESIGAALRKARERRRLTLTQVSETTKVRLHYLQALESDDISVMPSGAQARGFLRLYAGFLGLDLNELIPRPNAAPVSPVAAPVNEPPGHQTSEGPKATLPQLLTQLRSRLSRGGTENAGPNAESAGGLPRASESGVDPVPEGESQPAGKKKSQS